MKGTGPVPSASAWRGPLALSATLLLTGSMCVSPGRSAPRSNRAPGRPVLAGRLVHPDLRESSGIVASPRHPGAYWTMNDSGNAPVLYAVDATGRTLGTCRLRGARNVDWEDIAADADGRLYVADIGNNSRSRSALTIYALPEPDPTKTSTAAVAETFRFRYPPADGRFDAEAMFVRKGWAYVITKEPLTARLYRVRLVRGASDVVEAEPLGRLPKARWITAADISPDGRRIAALSYTTLYVYDLPGPIERLATSRPAASAPAEPTPPRVRVSPWRRFAPMQQAEGICWVAAAQPRELLITNEQRKIFRAVAPPRRGHTSRPDRLPTSQNTPATPSTQPARNTGQSKRSGTPPRAWEVRMRKLARISPVPASTADQAATRPPRARRRGRTSSAPPTGSSVSDTTTGAHTGATQATGMRNSTSQVVSEAGQSTRSLRKT